MKFIPSRIRSGLSIAFNKYLLLTNIISSGVLMLTGDLIQQETEYHKHKLCKRYDYGRLTRMLVVGSGLAPINHYFYIWAARLLPNRTVSTTIMKILLDQMLVSPICIVLFFYSTGILESKTIAECTEELKDKFMDVYRMDWEIWPPTQFFNFYYVPVKYQVFYMNIVSIVYNMFLSYFKFGDATEEHIHHGTNKK